MGKAFRFSWGKSFEKSGYPDLEIRIPGTFFFFVVSTHFTRRDAFYNKLHLIYIQTATNVSLVHKMWTWHIYPTVSEYWVKPAAGPAVLRLRRQEKGEFYVKSNHIMYLLCLEAVAARHTQVILKKGDKIPQKHVQDGVVRS